jgi:hypothetical protein
MACAVLPTVRHSPQPDGYRLCSFYTVRVYRAAPVACGAGPESAILPS